MKYKISGSKLAIASGSVDVYQFEDKNQGYLQFTLLRGIKPKVKLLLSTAYFLSLLTSLFTLLFN